MTCHYLSANLLLHAITMVELLAMLAMIRFMDATVYTGLVLAAFGLFPLFTQLDARSRFQEYRKVLDQLIRYGPDRRIFKSMAGSRCRRDAAMAAARQLGYATAGSALYTAAGYRWYHLVPDFVMRHPLFFLNAAFWHDTFFVPTYHARYPLSGNMRMTVPVWSGQAGKSL